MTDPLRVVVTVGEIVGDGLDATTAAGIREALLPQVEAALQSHAGELIAMGVEPAHVADAVADGVRQRVVSGDG